MPDSSASWQSGTRIEETRLVPEGSDTRLRWRMQECRCWRHRYRCRCPAVFIPKHVLYRAKLLSSEQRWTWTKMLTCTDSSISQPGRLGKERDGALGGGGVLSPWLTGLGWTKGAINFVSLLKFGVFPNMNFDLFLQQYCGGGRLVYGGGDSSTEGEIRLRRGRLLYGRETRFFFGGGGFIYGGGDSTFSLKRLKLSLYVLLCRAGPVDIKT